MKTGGKMGGRRSKKTRLSHAIALVSRPRANLSERLLIGWRRGRKLLIFVVSREITSGVEGHRTSSFVLSAIMRWKPIPTPSITARKTAHIIAEFRAALKPPRTAREPPVKKPARIAL